MYYSSKYFIYQVFPNLIFSIKSLKYSELQIFNTSNSFTLFDFELFQCQHDEGEVVEPFPAFRCGIESVEK